MTGNGGKWLQNLFMENIRKVVFEMQKIAGKVVFIKEQRLIKIDRLRRVSRANRVRVYEQRIAQTGKAKERRLRGQQMCLIF